jgi:hypothetical protein
LYSAENQANYEQDDEDKKDDSRNIHRSRRDATKAKEGCD